MTEITPAQWRTAVSVPSWVLGSVGTRPPVEVYLNQLWSRRHFILAESRAKVAGDLRRTVLGQAWLIINPVLNGLAFYVIFGLVLGTSRGIENFVGFLLIGVFFFQLTMRSLTGGAGSIRGGQAMIRAFAFPRAALPISVVVREVLNFLPTMVVLVVLLAVLPPAETVTWRVVLVIPAFALQVVFALGCALTAARICHVIPDMQNLISVLARFWLYGSGVFFSIDRFVEHPAIVTVMQINPMYNFLTIYRNSLLYGADSPMWMWLFAVGWSFAALIGGFFYFYAGEEKYGRA